MNVNEYVFFLVAIAASGILMYLKGYRDARRETDSEVHTKQCHRIYELELKLDDVMNTAPSVLRVEGATERAIVTIRYTNHRGKTAWRRIVPQAIRFADTVWHPGFQWVLDAIDVDKNKPRVFALSGVQQWRNEGESDHAES